MAVGIMAVGIMAVEVQETGTVIITGVTMTATVVTTAGARNNAANLGLGQSVALRLNYLFMPVGILFIFPLRSHTSMVNP